MVKIRNIYGDEYKGKQKHAVYQKKYGKQIRRLKEEHKANRAPAQLEQQRRFKIGISWYKSLSYFEKEGLKLFLNEQGINLTPQQYAIKTALDRGKVTKIVLGEQVIGEGAVEGWDVEGWPYRQEITITNNTASDLTNYQVKLELDASKVGPNFNWANQGNDLRFYDENGSKLSYYIESWDSVNKTATVWVRVGLIPANGQAIIKMYYGNPSAVSESDPEAVFEFFDDFEDDDYSGWQEFGGVIIGVETVDGRKVLHVHTGGSPQAVLYTAKSFARDVIIEAYLKTTVCFVGLGFLAQDGENFYLSRGKDSSRLVLIESGSFSWGVSGDGKTENNWYLYKVWFDGATIYADIDGSTVSKEDMTFSEGYVGLASWYGYGADYYLDWIRIRKYAEQEPAIEFGSEEEAGPGEPVTITVEHIIVEHSGMQNVMILDENGELIKEYTDLSDVANGDIATRIDFINKTEKTVRTVIIESISGVLNKVVL